MWFVDVTAEVEADGAEHKASGEFSLNRADRRYRRRHLSGERMQPMSDRQVTILCAVGAIRELLDAAREQLMAIVVPLVASGEMSDLPFPAHVALVEVDREDRPPPHERIALVRSTLTAAPPTGSRVKFAPGAAA